MTLLGDWGRRGVIALGAAVVLVGAWRILDPGPIPPAWYATYEAYVQQPACRDPRRIDHALLTLAPDILPDLRDRIHSITVTSAALGQPITASVTPDRQSVHYPGLFTAGSHKERYRVACDGYGCRFSFLAYIEEYDPLAARGEFTMLLADQSGAVLQQITWTDLPVPTASDPAVQDALSEQLTRLDKVERDTATLALPYTRSSPESVDGVILQMRDQDGRWQEAKAELGPYSAASSKARLPVPPDPAYLAALIWHVPAGQEARYEAKVEWIDQDDPYMQCEPDSP
ncbi:MAG: hypothetical protein Alpg2KO_27350 [Alphaproteobacteria bacterium]